MRPLFTVHIPELDSCGEQFSKAEKMEPLISIDQLDAGPVTSLDLNSNHGFGPIPEKRKKRAALLSAALSFVIMVVLLGGFTQPKSKLYVANTSSTVDDEMICKKNDREYYHVGVFIWSLNLIGVILGELMNRFCLVFEETFIFILDTVGVKRKCFMHVSMTFHSALCCLVFLLHSLSSLQHCYHKELTILSSSTLKSSSVGLAVVPVFYTSSVLMRYPEFKSPR